MPELGCLPVAWRRSPVLCSQIWRSVGLFPLLLLLGWFEWKTTEKATVSFNKAVSPVLKILGRLFHALAGRGGGGSWSTAYCIPSLWTAVVARGVEGMLQVKEHRRQGVLGVSGAPRTAVSSCAGRDGGGQRQGMARSVALGVFLEAFNGEGSQQRRWRAAASSGRRGLFAPWSILLQWIFFLQAAVPLRRILINLDSAFIIELVPSGFVPGDVLDGRRLEVLSRRWRRRTRLLFLYLSRVLFRISEDLVVIFSFFHGSQCNMYPPFGMKLLGP